MWQHCILTKGKMRRDLCTSTRQCFVIFEENKHSKTHWNMHVPRGSVKITDLPDRLVPPNENSIFTLQPGVSGISPMGTGGCDPKFYGDWGLLQTMTIPYKKASRISRGEGGREFRKLFKRLFLTTTNNPPPLVPDFQQWRRFLIAVLIPKAKMRSTTFFYISKLNQPVALK